MARDFWFKRLDRRPLPCSVSFTAIHQILRILPRSWRQSLGQGSYESFNQCAGECAVIQMGVENGHFHPHRFWTAERCAQDGIELQPREAIRQSVVDSRHDGVVQRIDVKTNPETVQPGARKTLNRLSWRCIDFLTSDFWQVDPSPFRRRDLAPITPRLLGRPKTEQAPLCVAAQRPITLERRHDV